MFFISMGCNTTSHDHVQVYGMDNRIMVGIADMKISADPDSLMITHALGSCLGIIIYDPVVKVAGFLHAMLPESKNDTRENLNP